MDYTLKQFRREAPGIGAEREECLMYSALDLVDAPQLREAADALRAAKDHFFRELARHEVYL